MIKVLNNVRLAPNIRLSELLCNDGSNETIYYQEDIEKLQMIRDYFNKGRIVERVLTIASAYRTLSYNTRIGGDDNSFHMIGRAYDIKIAGVSPALVGYIAYKMGFQGVGIYKSGTANFTHVDSREVQRLFRDDIYGTKTFEELVEKIESGRGV
jgi:uncharacterized protein YcbK (DUF882 family)